MTTENYLRTQHTTVHSRWRRFTWRHPEWWVFGLSLAAWLAILIRFDSAGAGLSLTHHHHHSSATLLWTSETLRWMTMVVAMMLPLIASSAQNAAAMSLWSRRNRAIAGFILGYLSIWFVCGILISLAICNLRLYSWFDPKVAIAASFCIAVTWQFTSLKKRALLSCHRTIPISPTGWRADFDCLRYGWVIGQSCFVSCWAWMLLCSVMEHNVIVMAYAGLIGIAERYFRWPNRYRISASLLELMRRFSQRPLRYLCDLCG